MDRASAERLRGLMRSWVDVTSAVEIDRARRFRATGSSVSDVAIALAESELRAAPGYARLRALDLEHHIAWRALLDRIARQPAR